MKTYLVGGAVRDRLLNRNAHDRDWVVVGGSTKEMLSLGFTQVGKDFPVFLHPKTREEYALARTERKTGSGYGGFVVDTDINVTLEEDLARRDLTINAMASDERGTIIDPFGGVNDIKNLRLRHITAAFAEDPLRVLRVARFKARFHHLGFIVDPKTCELMTDISSSGELTDLVVERIWIELNKSLMENTPSQFFLTLRDCGALNVLFPEIDNLFGVVQPKEHHPEIDTGIHTMMVLDQAAGMQADAAVRFAALLHDLGKADTASDMLPKHIGHEDKSVKRVNQLCSRLKTPKGYHELAVIVAKYHTLCHQVLNLKAGTVLKLLESIDVFRRPDRLDQFLQACKADALGRKGKERDHYEQERYLVEAYQVCSDINVQQIIEAGAKGAEISTVLKRKRCQAIAVMKSGFVSL